MTRRVAVRVPDTSPGGMHGRWTWGDMPKVACLPLALLFLASSVSYADSPRVLLERYKCYVCHADREARTGPAYVDIAQKYSGDSGARTMVVAEVRKGTHGSGPWPMPPHPEVAAADARTMVRYILSLRK
jgi:cytochrome c